MQKQRIYATMRCDYNQLEHYTEECAIINRFFFVFGQQSTNLHGSGEKYTAIVSHSICSVFGLETSEYRPAKYTFHPDDIPVNWY